MRSQGRSLAWFAGAGAITLGSLKVGGRVDRRQTLTLPKPVLSGCFEI